MGRERHKNAGSERQNKKDCKKRETKRRYTIGRKEEEMIRKICDSEN